MADATTTASAKKGSLPQWLTGAVNAMVAGMFYAPSAAAKIPHTHTEVADELHGTTKSFLLPGGASISSGINPTKGAEMLKNYLYGIMKTLGGSFGGAMMAMVRGKKQSSQAKDPASTVKSFSNIAQEAIKGTGMVFNSLLAFISARNPKTANSH